MAHYDLYQSLNLSPSDSSADLAQKIDHTLASGQYTNLGGQRELEIAREVLGNAEKRKLYDAKLADPSASDVTVGDLQQLSQMSLGTSVAATASKEADTGEIAAVRNQPEPPQYRQAPPMQPAPPVQQGYPPNYAPQGYAPQAPQECAPQGYAQPAFQQQQPKKSGGAKIISAGLAALVVIALIGAGLWFFMLQPSWKDTEAQIKDTYPNIVSARENGKGWQDLKCEGANPDSDQDAKILCGDEQTIISLVKFDSSEARDKYMPSDLVQVLDNGECTVNSGEVTGNDRPTYAMWSDDDKEMALLISGEDAEKQRMNLPLCK